MSTAKQKLEERLRAMVKKVIDEHHVPQVVYAKVTATAAGPSSLTLEIQGDTTSPRSGIRYHELTSPPTIGDTVVCHRVGTDLVVVAKVTP